MDWGRKQNKVSCECLPWRGRSSRLVCSCLECFVNIKPSLLLCAGAVGHRSKVSGKLPGLSWSLVFSHLARPPVWICLGVYIKPGRLGALPVPPILTKSISHPPSTAPEGKTITEAGFRGRQGAFTTLLPARGAPGNSLGQTTWLLLDLYAWRLCKGFY